MQDSASGEAQNTSDCFEYGKYIGILLTLRRRLKPDGSLFLVYLTLYSVWRLGIDFVRDGTPFLFGLHQAQVVSIIVLAITIRLIIKTRLVRKEKAGEELA